MKQESFGELIYRLRKAKKMTQEELCGDICSASTISKIENGSQVPNRQTFQKLMERLGQPDYFYGDYFSPTQQQWECHQQQFLMKLEFGQIEQAEESLWLLKQICQEEKEDLRKHQTYELYSLMWRQQYECQRFHYREICERLIRLTYPEYSWDYFMTREYFEWENLLLFNNLAMGFYWENKIQQACAIWIKMLLFLEGYATASSQFWKRKSVICHNLSLACLELQRMEEAKHFHKQGMMALQKSGSFPMYLHYLQMQMQISKISHEKQEYEKRKELMEQLLMLSKFYGYDLGSREDFMVYPKGICVW